MGGNLACTGQITYMYSFCRNIKELKRLRDLSGDGRIILKSFFDNAV
jgi:hypothetical protein